MHCNNRNKKKVSSKREERKTMKTMKKEINEIKTLEYQIRRYQAMGNGVMCQALQVRLNQLRG